MKKIEIARALAAARSAGDAAGQGHHDGADLTGLTQLQGLGRTRARRLHDELGIETLEELAAALLDGSVQSLRGFGAEACERLRAELTQHFERSRCFSLADAEAHAQPLIEHLAALPAVERVEIAGSVRRRCPVVGDVDLLVVSSRPAQVMRQFATYPYAERVEGLDASRGSIVLQCGLRVDIRVVPRRCFGATLQFLTGSPAHNVAIRRLGLECGFRVSEYGVFSVDHSRAGARRTGGQREEDIFEALGLQWIPPELREDSGELELAGERRLPRLVAAEDLTADLHIAVRPGADHAALLAAARAHPWACVALVRPARAHADAAAFADSLPEPGGLRVLRGVHVAVTADGTLEAAESDLEDADIVFAELRAASRLSRARTTERIVRALEHPLVDVLAWPPTRSAASREPCDLDYDAIFTAVAAAGVALELGPCAVPCAECDAQVRRAAELGVSFVLGSGARTPDGLGGIRYALDRARRGWLEAGSILNTQGPAAIEQWLQRRAPHRAPYAAAR